MPLLLDAAYTLIRPSEQVGEAYARHLEAASGIRIDPHSMHAAFGELFTAAPAPAYRPRQSGQAAERSWWRGLVRDVLLQVGDESASFAERQPAFDSFFDSLFAHFADPAAWSLYPETVEFLEGASRHGPLAVVSNFDDRLAPILDGLGIGRHFELITTSADARARKPEPAIFKAALDRLNCAPEEAIHCGDSYEADYLGATAAGLRAFHLRRPEHTLLDFLDYANAPVTPTSDP